ncbi:MAG: tRNA adenosine(34) deaminase TadA [Candidatus Izemoplasmatales bacterium]|nr:tRNA adenosine(34) deaminase TadA [Candidatus Izemoplasmatales bacterium]
MTSSINKDQDQRLMKAALLEARKAGAKGEVPIGAVIVKDGKIIARGHNEREQKQSVLAHAELVAIKKAEKKLGTWRLEDCTLYVTIEPCPMCAGAIIQSRIARVVYGAKEPKFGAHTSIINVFDQAFNHQVEVKAGVCEQETSKLMKSFFRALRD